MRNLEKNDPNPLTWYGKILESNMQNLAGRHAADVNRK